jgi:hypothetical protein
MLGASYGLGSLLAAGLLRQPLTSVSGVRDQTDVKTPEGDQV